MYDQRYLDFLKQGDTALRVTGEENKAIKETMRKLIEGSSAPLKVLKDSYDSKRQLYFAAVQETGIVSYTGEIIDIHEHCRNTFCYVAYIYFSFGHGQLNYRGFEESSLLFRKDKIVVSNTILNLLTPSTDIMARKWRRFCINENSHLLENLPLDSKIKVFEKNGKSMILLKKPANGHFKGAWWKVDGELKYYKRKYIRDYEVVQVGEDS